MNELSPESWDARYRNQNTPWDLSGPTPEFVRLLKEPWFPRKGRALVPGGGRGYDAALLSQTGFETDLVDFAPLALQQALEQAAKARVNFYAYKQDFFALPSLPYHQERYDLFLEYTFFCAIDPILREKYVLTAASLLKSGGLFVGLFFPTSSDKAGPPFVVSSEEVEKIFSPHFHVRIESPQTSVKPREGKEFLGIFKKKS